MHPFPAPKQDLGRHLLPPFFGFQRKDTRVLSRGELWNAPARSLVTEQSGLPVIPKHVPHPQSVHRQSQVKPTSLPSLKSHFGDGWTKSLCFLSHFPTSASAQTSVYGQAVLFTFLSFPDGCPSCSGMLRATNKIFIQCCWHQMKVLSKLFARIYCLFILVPLRFFKVCKAYLSLISRSQVLSLTHPKQSSPGLIMVITVRVIQRHPLSVARGWTGIFPSDQNVNVAWNSTKKAWESHRFPRSASLVYSQLKLLLYSASSPITRSVL